MCVVAWKEMRAKLKERERERRGIFLLLPSLAGVKVTMRKDLLLLQDLKDTDSGFDGRMGWMASSERVSESSPHPIISSSFRSRMREEREGTSSG